MHNYADIGLLIFGTEYYLAGVGGVKIIGLKILPVIYSDIRNQIYLDTISSFLTGPHFSIWARCHAHVR
jgi:hypothetical protein